MSVYTLRRNRRYGLNDSTFVKTFVRPLSYIEKSNPDWWLEADAITGLSNGDKVETWTDQSANGWDGFQNTSGLRPTYKSDTRNGLPGVTFADQNQIKIASGGLGIIRNIGEATTVTVFQMNEFADLRRVLLFSYKQRIGR
jgi:hypothetical protein